MSGFECVCRLPLIYKNAFKLYYFNMITSKAANVNKKEPKQTIAKLR